MVLHQPIKMMGGGGRLAGGCTVTVPWCFSAS